MDRAALRSGLLIAVLTGAAVAQTTIRSTTTLVVVPTVVQTAEKELVVSLAADDFVVTDNGVRQKVMLEEEKSRPLSLVVLMQTGGIARGQFASYGNLETMLAAVLGKTPNRAAIVNFDSRPEAASPFTSDIAEWSDAINHPDQGDDGAAILDSISFGLDLLKKEPLSNRRAILLISQEHDNGSKVQMKDIVRRMGETNTAIYAMTFSAEKTVARQAFKDPPHLNPSIAAAPGGTQGYFSLSEPLRLVLGGMRKNLSAEVANLSGGESSSFDNQHELEAGLGVLANHVRNSYMLSFYPASTEPGLHTIEVRLRRHPEMTVSARRNYWVADSTTTENQH